VNVITVLERKARDGDAELLKDLVERTNEIVECHARNRQVPVIEEPAYGATQNLTLKDGPAHRSLEVVQRAARVGGEVRR